MSTADSDDTGKILVRNRKARHEYFVEETLEAGIELRGSEVKSLRDAQASISDAYAAEKEGQMFLLQLQINEYPQANVWNHAPKRDRKLLLHKKQIIKLGEKVKEKGYTLLPLEIYLNAKGRVKVLLGLCKGKQQHDKRQATKERDAKREMARSTGRRGGR